MGDAVHLRVRAGMRRPHNWLQLGKFCAVGASGYVVNLCVFALCFEVLHIHHLLAATAAWIVLKPGKVQLVSTPTSPGGGAT